MNNHNAPCVLSGHQLHPLTIPGTIPEESSSTTATITPQVVPDLHNTSLTMAPGNQSSFFNQTASLNYQTPDRTNPFRKMIENAYGPSLDYTKSECDSKTSAHGDIMDKGFIDSCGEPRVTFAEVPTRVRYESKPKNRFHGYHSYVDSSHDSSGSSAGVDNTDGNVEYSCADMSEALHSKPPGNFACNLTVDDDDAATTTSGSYVVDPEDLCNEIDDLFFKDMVL